MSYIKNYYLFIFSVFVCISCDKYIDEDLSEESLVVLSPANNIVTTNANISFWWENLKTADVYCLQVVTPNFQKCESLVLDTNIVGTKFEFDFAPGKYEYRLRASNSFSQTNFFYGSFEIDSTLYLGKLKVELQFPARQTYLNTNNVLFTWGQVEKADSYVFSLQKGDESGIYVIYPQTISSISLESNDFLDAILEEGEYTWSVFAENTISTSLSNFQTFFIDRTAPNVAKLEMPKDIDTLSTQNNGVTFTWVPATDNYKFGADSIFVYQIPDSLAKTKVLIGRYSGDATCKVTNLSPRKWYLWSIVSYDAALNKTQTIGIGNRFYIKD